MFARKPKSNPTIVVDGIDVSFDLRNSWWEFVHQGIDFISYETTLEFPCRDDLESILADIRDLEAEMKSRIALHFEPAPEIDANDGEFLHVNIASFTLDRSFNAAWAGEKSWGDLGVDFTIKNGVISDEAWSD